MNSTREAVFPPPVVSKAPDGVLNPAQLSGDVTVEVAYPDMQPTDRIRVVWNGNVFPEQAGDPSGAIAFVIASSYVEMGIGKVFPVTYRVTRDNVTSESHPFYVRVLTFRVPSAQYPDAPFETVDPRLFEGDLLATIAPWSLIAEGQSVLVEAKASIADGTHYAKTLRTGSVTADEVVKGLSVFVPRGDIEAMGNDASFVVATEVTFGNGVSIASRNVLMQTLVSGEGVPLAPPSIDEAVEGVLPRNVSSIHVRIPASAQLKTGDLVIVHARISSTALLDLSRQVTNEAGREMVFDSPWTEEIANMRGETLGALCEIRRASGDFQPWSPELRLFLEGGEAFIPVVDHHVGGYLDPAHAPEGTNVRTPPLWSATDGTIVRVQWTGASAATSMGAVFDGVQGMPVVCPIPPRYIVENNLEEVVAYYLLEYPGANPVVSPLLRFTVGPGPLPMPKVVQATGNTLAPLMAIDGATVRVSYPDMRETDTIALSFDGNDAFPVQSGSASGGILFAVSAADVARAVNRTVVVTYTRLRDGVSSVSRNLALVVEAIPKDALPLIQVPAAVGGVVDLRTFEGDATVVVPAWPLIAAGQTIWLKFIGIQGGEGGSPVLRELLNNYRLTPDDVANGVTATMPRSDLERIIEGLFSLEAQVAFDGADAEATGVPFRPAEFQVAGGKRRQRQ